MKKGVKFSDEHKTNISIARKGKYCGENNPFYGKKHSEESLKKISRKGCTLSEEHKKKISLSLLGSKNHFFNKHHTDNSREKLKASWKESILKGERCGVNHPNWKGGISNNGYCPLFTNKEFRLIILERDSFQCLNPACGTFHKRKVIHHIDYNKKNCSVTNLITLCVSCNSKANFDREWHQEWYSLIVKRRYYE